MQRINGISGAEWRWVIVISGLLIALTALPYVWAFTSDSYHPDVKFMGLLISPVDGATYLSKIRMGMAGSWLYTLKYSTEPNQGAAVQEFYLFLGHVARVMGFSALQMYHVARLVTGFLMLLSFYYLGAVIWPRVRPRRIFFGLLAVGSGLGWLAVALFGSALSSDANNLPSDIFMPESIPFYAAFTNPHFPLAIACITLIAAIFVVVFRPGFTEQPTATNGGFSLVFLVVCLSIVQPQGAVGILAGISTYLLITIVRMRRVNGVETLWVLVAILSALPLIAYYTIAVQQDPVLNVIWNLQTVSPSPPIWAYIIGFGLPLFVAIPGIWRGIRYFEQDGDRFMVVWLLANALILYLPFNLQRRAAIGLIIPIVYFAVRSLEDYWFRRLSHSRRKTLLVALFILVLPSSLLILKTPMSVLANGGPVDYGSILLNSDHTVAIAWLRDHAKSNDVALAPPEVSLWIPAYSDLRVVYGHGAETLYAVTKESDVKAWFAGEKCKEVLSMYSVSYVVSPIIEGDNAPTDDCYTALGQPVAKFGQVYVYKVQ
jgi:hypothetical protein